MSTVLAWLPEIVWMLIGLYVVWKVYQLVRDVRRARLRAWAAAYARRLGVVDEVPPPKPAPGTAPPPDFED